MMLTNKKTLIGILAGLALSGVLFLSGGETFIIESALAQSSPVGGGTGTSNIFSETTNKAMILLSFMQFLTFLIIYLLQALLDPGFLNNVMTGSLRDIWIFSRDLMNVIFAFILVGAGIFTVVTGNKEVVATKYKNFILAIVLVNFSWFFPRLIIDVANVLTATIYQIPNGMQVNGAPIECKDPETGEACRAITKLKLGKECKKQIADQETNSTPSTNPEYYLGYVANVVCVHYEEIGSTDGPGQYTSAGMLNGLVLGYGRLSTLPLVLNPDTGPGTSTEMERLTSYFFFLMHILLVVGLMAMLFLPLLAMLVVFIIRIPIIWFTVAFMPFMFFGFVAGEKLTAGFNTMDIFKHFTKAAFLPVALAVPLCVGFILLSTVGTQGCAATVGATNPLCLKTGAMIHGIDNMWSLLWLLMTFFVIWKGFFMAMSIDSIYEGATAGIKNFGSSVGSAALKVPLSIPIPTGGGKSMSLNQMAKVPRNFSNKLDNMTLPQAMKSGSGSDGSNVVNALKDTQSPMNKALAEIAQKSGAATVNSNGKASLDLGALKIEVKNQIENNREQFNNNLRSQGVSEDKIKNIKPDEFLANLNQSKITGAIQQKIDDAKPSTNTTP